MASFLAMMAISRWPIVASIQKTPRFISCYDLVEKCPIFVSTINQVTASHQVTVTLVLCRDTWSTVLSNTRHVQVIKQNSVASTMANPCYYCGFTYHLGTVGIHQHCNFFDIKFSSNWSWPNGMLIFHTTSPLCKMSMPLKQPKDSLLYVCLIIWNVSPRLKLWNFLFLSLAVTQWHSNSLSEYTTHTELLLAATREERTQHHLMAPRICCGA
jgi:hypothetical protein